MRDFAETARRNWNHGGHSVDMAQFTADRGFWDYAATTYEPWLFDRADVWRMFAEMTGEAQYMTQAASDLAYYESRIAPAGYFLNKGGEQDSKYCYPHPWSTNRSVNEALYRFARDNAQSAGSSLWTERELWVVTNAACKWHDISGEAAALTLAQSMVDQWDAVCAGRPAPLVSYTQHEGGGPGGTQPTDLVSSPWMAALYFQAARIYVSKVPAARAQVYAQASRYFDWLNTAGTRGFYPGSDAHPEFTGLTFPAYLAGGTTIGDAGPDEGNMGHALDVAGLCQFAITAKTARSESTAQAVARRDQMLACAVRDIANWTRDTNYLPKFRITPPRKFSWQVRGLYELMYA